jgi:hypothetical protein
MIHRYDIEAGLLNSPAFLEVQITSPKTNYLEPLYFADTVNVSPLLDCHQEL